MDPIKLIKTISTYGFLTMKRFQKDAMSKCKLTMNFIISSNAGQ